jgi:hypothetical protein
MVYFKCIKIGEIPFLFVNLCVVVITNYTIDMNIIIQENFDFESFKKEAIVGLYFVQKDDWYRRCPSTNYETISPTGEEVFETTLSRYSGNIDGQEADCEE